MLFITRETIERAIIEQSNNEFDTHDVIFEIMTISPQEYIRELNAYIMHDDPFFTVHGALGQEMTTMPELVQQQHRKQLSLNVRGKMSYAEIWHRVF